MIFQTGKLRKTERAFTLIELVLVMAILIVVLSMTGASLTHFFRGRTLDAEARRFLALTRYAQSRAVSEGLPMTLWIDERGRRYGLEIAGSLTTIDQKAVEFELGRDLTVKVERPLVTSALTIASQRSANQVTMRFTPDGYMDENNPDAVLFGEKSDEPVVIVPSRNRLYYEISTNQFYTIRR
jgi:type II secretion system protein H